MRSVGPRSNTALPIVLVDGESTTHFLALETLADERAVVSWSTPKPLGAASTIGRARARAAQLASVCDWTASPRVHVLAHGFGGLAAALFALAEPQRIGALVFVDGVPAHAAGVTAARARNADVAPREPDFDLRDDLAKLRIPTLAFSCGIPFGNLGTEIFDAMCSAPRQLYTLPSSGHLPWLDAPRTFFAQLRAFLRESDG